MAGVIGMDAETGKMLDGIDHLIQSIRDIFTTRIGSRVMRREYGSELPRLIDQPMNNQLLIEIYVAAIDALDRWEPRFRIKRVLVAASAPGSLTLDLFGTYLLEGREIMLEGIQI